jgi:hypothetical protein
MAETKNISYLNKSFSDFKSTLIDYAKAYFPSAYNDFSEASPGLMFIEMASYVGDVLSFYVDTQLQENFLLYTKEKSNAIALAYSLGYRPKVSYASHVELEISQLAPAITDVLSGQDIPDSDYCMVIPANSSVSSINGINFITLEDLDFSITSGRDVSFFSNTNFLLTKRVKAISAEVKTITHNFGSTPTKFNSLLINDDSKILQVLEVTDSLSNRWYEVPYLAQENVINKTINSSSNIDGVNYVLGYTKTPRRFVTRFDADGTLELQFGAGVKSDADTVLLPNPNDAALGTVQDVYDPSNTYNKAAIFVTREYGLAPTGTFTIKYLVGGGVASNVDSNNIIRKEFTVNDISYKGNISTQNKNDYFETLTITNPLPSSGGRDGDTVEEIRQNTLHAFAAQNRAVTKQDYMSRILSMDNDFGSVAKVYISQDAQLSPNSGNDRLLDNNPLSISAYVLAYNANKNIISASTALKNNIKTHLSEYKLLTDSINIKNAFYINVGVNFDITISTGYSNKDVLTNCLTALKDHFDISKWQINQPIILSDVNSILLQVKGVQSVVKVELSNKQGGNYSPYGYDIKGATKNGVIYPSMDPAIFEVRYPDVDIQGRVITL